MSLLRYRRFLSALTAVGVGFGLCCGSAAAEESTHSLSSEIATSDSAGDTYLLFPQEQAILKFGPTTKEQAERCALRNFADSGGDGGAMKPLSPQYRSPMELGCSLRVVTQEQYDDLLSGLPVLLLQRLLAVSLSSRAAPAAFSVGWSELFSSQLFSTEDIVHLDYYPEITG